MNRQHHLHASLAFRYYNPFEKNLEIILDEICKNELDYVTAPGESVKHKLVNLIANRLLLVRKANGLALLQKEKELVKDSTLTSAYTNHLRDSFIIYEENKLTSLTRAHERQQRDMDYFTARRNRENAFGVQAE
jgi:nucleoside diphosphate kinase